MSTKAKIRDEGQKNYRYQELRMPPATNGKHKYSNSNEQYRDVHDFMKQRQWAPIDAGSSTGGTTWLELFILFDVTGARSSNGDHVKDIEAAKRAKARSSKHKKQEGKRKAQTATVKPSMGEDIGRFKAIARHIDRREVDKEQAGWFEMEKR